MTRVAVFSMGPVFPSHVHGGSQKTLAAVVRQLASDGFRVSVYCTRRDDNHQAFALHPNATVHPVLRFKQTYPEPYYAAPYHLGEVVSVLARAAADHDRFYVHDGELLYHFIYDEVPTVVSFQDFVYPDTLAGALSFRRDHLLLSSPYVQSCVEQVFRHFRPLPAGRVSHVPNGFDVDVLCPRDPSALRTELGLAPDALAVLFPHRPDPRKGIWESLRVLLRALDSLPESVADRIRLLVPVWVDSNVAESSEHVYQGLYGEIAAAAAQAGRPNLVHFHPWLPVARMPEYYSLGSVTLCIGSFVEAFGNVSVESQLCGTPAVVARVGAQRTVLPESLVAKIDYDDEKTAADFLVQVLTGQMTLPGEDFRDYVRATYSEAAMVEGYARVILGAERTAPLPAVGATGGLPARVEVPAWCALLESGYYNDYEYGYSTDLRLHHIAGLAADGPVDIARLGDLADPRQIASWISNGYLAPAVP